MRLSLINSNIVMSDKEMAIHPRKNSGNWSHCPMGTMFAKSDVKNLEKVSRYFFLVKKKEKEGISIFSLQSFNEKLAATFWASLVIATFYTSMHQTSVLNWSHNFSFQIWIIFLLFLPCFLLLLFSFNSWKGNSVHNYTFGYAIKHAKFRSSKEMKARFIHFQHFPYPRQHKGKATLEMWITKITFSPFLLGEPKKKLARQK